MSWFSLITNALLRRRLLGMSLREFAEMASSDPAAAAFLIRSVGDVLQVTAERLATKASQVDRPKRAQRLLRRAQQRHQLAKLAHDHAQDLMLQAEGLSAHCSADPLRKPLT